MKLTVVSKNTRQAEAKMEDGRLIYFATTNSSWYDYDMDSRKVGDVIEVPDNAIKISDKGRPFIDRLGADKYVAEMTIKASRLKVSFLEKQIAKMDVL